MCQNCALNDQVLEKTLRKPVHGEIYCFYGYNKYVHCAVMVKPENGEINTIPEPFYILPHLRPMFEKMQLCVFRFINNPQDQKFAAHIFIEPTKKFRSALKIKSLTTI